jgi:hypothetical protein
MAPLPRDWIRESTDQPLAIYVQHSLSAITSCRPKNWSGEMDSNHRLYSFASCCLGPLGHPRANHCVLQCSYITIGKPDCQQLITISCIGNFLLFWSRLLGFGCYLGLNCRASIIVVGSLRRCPANLHSIYVSVTIN